MTTARTALLSIVAAVLAIAIAAPDAVAQRGPGSGPGPGVIAKREKLRQRIKAMRAWILTEELELDEATAGKLVPVLAKYDDEMARLLVERNQLRRQLADAATSDDAKLDGLIDKLVANQQARWDTEQKRFADLRKLLTAKQTAHLVDVLPDLDRRILKGLRNAGGARQLIDGGAVDADGDNDNGDDSPPPPPRRRGRGGRQAP